MLICHSRFLLPTLHVKMILEMRTISKRREALERLPSDLYDWLQSIITRIKRLPNASAELGMRILMWLHFARRPLKLVELQHALAVRESDTEFDAGNIPSQKALLNCCLGLVAVDDTLTVRFVHFTLEQYFYDNSQAEFPDGYSSIANTCLTYLNFGELRQNCDDNESLKDIMNRYPFLDYAAIYWGTYVNQQCNDTLTELARKLVDGTSRYLPYSIEVLKRHLYPQASIGWQFLGIHAIAYFGLSEIMAYFLRKKVWQIDLQDLSGRTPLSWAAENGHEVVVRLLIEGNRVDINTKTCMQNTPLLLAAGNGHEAVVRLLIESGRVDINAKDHFGNTPFSMAVEKGHEAVVQLLIERDDLDINVKDHLFDKSLLVAAENGYGAIVHLLLERYGVGVNATDNQNNTPLLVAAKNGLDAVVRFLVERDGVDVNAKDRYGRTLFMKAAESRWGDVVRLLIERDGVDVNAKGRYGSTPLIKAAENGWVDVVQLLIERDDVDVNARDNDGNTPLSIAALRGHAAVMRLLIKRGGVDVNAKGRDGSTLLMTAAENGWEDVVQLLIERDGVDINARDNNGNTPLSIAAGWRHEGIVQLLINHRRRG